ncbi:hypothetical protein COO60DRAFT_1015207 [Scenedesmus sp. NREL 46B-D3]|nr:hypothetical protein COO60DRAFT_1015207 [Scenedesmus sp. NREL 46B-D3]
MVAPPPPLEDAAISRENNRAPSRVCRLRGLPYTASDDDICSFFCNFTLDEVYICRRDGRATGEAYVMFTDAAQAGSAMEKCNKKYLGSRYIEIFEAAEADLVAVKKVLEDTQLQGCVVRLRGLPYTATAEDVATFFEGVQLAGGDDAIVFTTTVDGRPTGECYVELADRDAQAAAMMRHKDVMGARYIEIFHSSKMDKLQAQQQRLSMPPSMYARWGAQPMRPGLPTHNSVGAGYMQPAVLAAAAAAGNKIASGVDQLTGSLQGTHLHGSGGRVMPPMQQQHQQQQLYQQPYPQRQVLVQPHMVSVPAAAAAAPGATIDHSSSNSVSNGNSVPLNCSDGLTAAAVSALPGPMTPAVSSGYYQGPAPAAVMSQPGVVMHPYGAVMSGTLGAGGALGHPDAAMQHQLQPHVYYMPMQQGCVPPRTACLRQCTRCHQPPQQ